jgi:hypothetical protein
MKWKVLLPSFSKLHLAIGPLMRSEVKFLDTHHFSWNLASVLYGISWEFADTFENFLSYFDDFEFHISAISDRTLPIWVSSRTLSARHAEITSFSVWMTVASQLLFVNNSVSLWIPRTGPSSSLTSPWLPTWTRPGRSVLLSWHCPCGKRFRPDGPLDAKFTSRNPRGVNSFICEELMGVPGAEEGGSTCAEKLGTCVQVLDQQTDQDGPDGNDLPTPLLQMFCLWWVYELACTSSL